eukprot:CAMPEP_0194579438 /NCGR_PEP_ID=MMETSP0292-20121207/13503_1 /TAXON_ID=39354 /ORGANISM="Heterosigma akashiwo, Strain CCMP2393" /LENGTH=244 /DNA_ID=CAMNT_0039432387 /DNA_START=32 /DNA_END=768 /DNA_ORIENTATION=+
MARRRWMQGEGTDGHCMGLSHRGLPEEEEATVEEVSAVVVARAGRDKKGIQPGQEAQVQVGGAMADYTRRREGLGGHHAEGRNRQAWEDMYRGWYPLGFDLPGPQEHGIKPSVHSERSGWACQSRSGGISEAHMMNSFWPEDAEGEGQGPEELARLRWAIGERARVYAEQCRRALVRDCHKNQIHFPSPAMAKSGTFGVLRSDETRSIADGRLLSENSSGLESSPELVRVVQKILWRLHGMSLR